MTDKVLHIQTLGKFSLRWGDAEIDDSGNRSRKVWLLLAYMIYCRDRAVSNSEFASLLWSDEEDSVNPLNALKTMFHRVRAFLDQLEPGLGHQLILRRQGGYAWNTAFPLELDVERFESLCARKSDDEETRIAALSEAMSLYKGDFLNKLSSEPWVVPIAAYYHQRYLDAALEVLPVLEREGRWKELSDLCQTAVIHEPYNEDLYRFLIRALLAMGDQRGAVTVYEEMSELLFSNFGVMPSDETRALYRQAVRTVNDRTVASGVIMDQLREPTPDNGALMCDYDFFKVVYHAVARSIERSGDAVHLALLSVTDENGGELSKRSLDRVMENLQEVVRANLRRGDIAARCSVSQFVLMLPQANYEDSCMVANRLARSFARQYPHSPARIHAVVHPLEPLQ